MTEQDILVVLASKFQKPEWNFFMQLKSKPFTSHKPNVGRVIDAYALNNWETRKYKAIAFEIKTNRMDFLKEIDDPAKREFFVKYSNEFYFVCPAHVIATHEVPEECGLWWVYSTGYIKKKKVAPYHELEYLPVSFVASLLNNDLPELTSLKLLKYCGRNVTPDDLLGIIEEQGLSRINTQEIEREIKAAITEIRQGIRDVIRKIYNKI